jgi:hypothetical protein
VVLVLFVLILAGGYVGVSLWKDAAEDRLAVAEGEAIDLVKQKANYDEVVQVNRDLRMTQSALTASMSYEIRWPDLVDQMFKHMPEGAKLESIALRGMSASEAVSASENVLAPARIGTVTMTVQAPSLTAVGDWIDSFNLIPGIEDATWNSLTSTAVGQAEGFTVAASAQVNLVGLSGNPALPEDFRDWLTDALKGGQPLVEEGAAD